MRGKCYSFQHFSCILTQCKKLGRIKNKNKKPVVSKCVPHNSFRINSVTPVFCKNKPVFDDKFSYSCSVRA